MALAALLSVMTVAGCGAPRNPYFDPSKPHHRPDGFVNSDPQATVPPLAFPEQLYLNLTGYFRPQSAPQGGYEAFAREWSTRIDREWLRANRTATAVTWLGHASVLLQIDGLNILADPVFSERASPLSFAGPKRRVPAPAHVPELPPIDLVLISHNHYDHLDRATVVALAQANPAVRFIVPLGLKSWFASEGIESVSELDWWDRFDAGAALIHLTPVQHWSKRTISDRNQSLWGGFVVETKSQRPWRFFFTGDTGYSADFKAIRARLGPMDFAAIAVGGYAPRDFMRVQHVNPEEAVQIVLDLDARAALGIHWGTFELTQEPFDQPPEDLAAARAKLGVAPERFFLMKHGETRRIER